MRCKVRIKFSAKNPTLTMALSDYAIANKLTPFISMQNHYNLIYREEEPTLEVLLIQLFGASRGFAHYWQYFGVGMIPWSPLARGILTHPLNASTRRKETDK
jgi:aryl-alcohol dehydrogenase-like predicted oxidoreductase